MSLCASSSPTIESEHYQQLSTISETKMHNNDIQKPNTQGRTEQNVEKTTGHRVVHMLATRDSKHTQSPGYQPTQPRGGRGATHPRHPCHLLAEQKVPTPSQMGEHRTHTQIPPGRPRTCTVLANTAHGGAKGMGNKKRGSPHAFMTYINPFQLRQKGEAQCLRQRSFSLSKDSVSGPIFPCSPANSLQLNSLTCSLFPF